MAAIVPYIKKDPKGYFNAEKSKIAFDTYLKISDLRAQSISKQLEGKLATRSDEQNKEDQIDVSKMLSGIWVLQKIYLINEINAK